MRLRIALCDPDTDYAMRIAECVRHGTFGKEVEMEVCTRPELLAEWRKAGRCDRYVVGAAWSDRIGPIAPGDRSVVFIGEAEGAAAPNGTKVLLKYGAAPALIRAWTKDIGMMGRGEANKAAIVGVWSPSGGAGRTTLIARLTKLRASRGLRTFAAGIDPGTVRGAEQEHDLTDWLFRLKSGAEVETFATGALVHAFAGSSSYREWSGIGSAEGEKLLDAAAAAIGAGAVLADAGSGWSHWAEAVWNRSVTMICLIPEDAESIEKADRWLSDWPKWGEEGAWRRKSVMTLNRCLHQETPEALRKDWVKDAHRLPYVPEWKQYAEWSDPLYQAAAERLLAEVMERCGEK